MCYSYFLCSKTPVASSSSCAGCSASCGLLYRLCCFASREPLSSRRHCFVTIFRTVGADTFDGSSSDAGCQECRVLAIVNVHYSRIECCQTTGGAEASAKWPTCEAQPLKTKKDRTVGTCCHRLQRSSVKITDSTHQALSPIDSSSIEAASDACFSAQGLEHYSRFAFH